MTPNHIQNIKDLLVENNYSANCQIIPMPSSGSNRLYYRVLFDDSHNPKSIIASYNNDVDENIAHSTFTKHFENLNFNVPHIIASDGTSKYFLLQDLGNITLFNLLSTSRVEALEYYKTVVNDLIKFQFDGIKNLDLSVAYPIKEFNERAIMWDLNYFKYYFVKPNNIEFNENLLQNDFENFANLLLTAENNYFNYRDFQARNIMIYNNKPWYIDFQGGRKGALQYDLVSLLYQAKANLSDNEKQVLYNHYLQQLNLLKPDAAKSFEKHFNDFVFFRLMQVLGAYGFRGLVQRKAHFLQSIPNAIDSLSKMLNTNNIADDFPELNKVFEQILQLNYDDVSVNNSGLTVNVNSFSFKKKGIPTDFSGNGGGFVFDCRSLPNPGRLAELRDYTGLQTPVINYLKEQPEVDDFLKNAINNINQSVQNYISRNFNNLQINFGCTGGRHRSVYTASTVAEYLKSSYPDVNVVLTHFEI